MADTATTPGGARQIEQYTLENSWGPELNLSLQRLADLSKVRFVTVNANVTLAYNDFIDHQSSALVLVLTGSGGFTITEPGKSKPYFVVNLCAANVTMRPLVASTMATIRAGTWALYYPAADNSAGYVLDITLDKVKAPTTNVSLNAQRLINLAAPVNGSDAVTKAYADAIINLVDADAATASAAATTATTQAGLALAAYDAFDDRYLGAKASDPTLDNDGNALAVGALYWNSAAGQMRVWSGANWVAITVLSLSTQAQAEAGTDNATAMTPLRTKQAITAQVEVRPNVVSATKTDTFVLATTNTWTDVPGLSVTITPRSTSRIMISGAVNFGHSAANLIAVQIVRGATPLAIGDAAGARSRATTGAQVPNINTIVPVAFNLVDSPATSAPTTYKVQIRISNATAYVNRDGNDSDGSTTYRVSSSITAMEIGV